MWWKSGFGGRSFGGKLVLGVGFFGGNLISGVGFLVDSWVLGGRISGFGGRIFG